MILAVFHDFPGLENGLTKFHDFPGRMVTLQKSHAGDGCIDTLNNLTFAKKDNDTVRSAI